MDVGEKVGEGGRGWVGRQARWLCGHVSSRLCFDPGEKWECPGNCKNRVTVPLAKLLFPVGVGWRVWNGGGPAVIAPHPPPLCSMLRVRLHTGNTPKCVKLEVQTGRPAPPLWSTSHRRGSGRHSAECCNGGRGADNPRWEGPWTPAAPTIGHARPMPGGREGGWGEPERWICGLVLLGSRTWACLRAVRASGGVGTWEWGSV